jgi:hypothetical protein
MEAWNFVNFSSLSPVFALSLTTEQWGLEPFPGNLVAIPGYWQDIQGSNNTVETAWTLPYSCPSSNSSNNCAYNDWVNIDYCACYDSVTNTSFCAYDDWVSGFCACYDNVTSIYASSNICPGPEPCADSGCMILIEGIGKTTTGPANSSIVGLSYGISFLLVYITVSIIMGCSSSSLLDPSPPPTRLALEDVRQYVNPPPQPEKISKVRAAAAANTAKEVARCSDLLRQMYALDLVIWGMEDNIAEDIPKREDMKRRANALFAEICRIVHTWKSRPGASWSPEERQYIDEICRFVDQHNTRRYEG